MFWYFFSGLFLASLCFRPLVQIGLFFHWLLLTCRNTIHFCIQQPCWTLLLILFVDSPGFSFLQIISSANKVSYASFFPILLSPISCSYFVPLVNTSTQCWVEMVLMGTLVSFLLAYSSWSKTTVNPKAMAPSFHLPLNNYTQIKAPRSHISQKFMLLLCALESML